MFGDSLRLATWIGSRAKSFVQLITVARCVTLQAENFTSPNFSECAVKCINCSSSQKNFSCGKFGLLGKKLEKIKTFEFQCKCVYFSDKFLFELRISNVSPLAWEKKTYISFPDVLFSFRWYFRPEEENSCHLHTKMAPIARTGSQFLIIFH